MHILNSYISIELNGKLFNCKKSLSLNKLLLYLNIDMSSTIIEYNKEIVQEAFIDQINLHPGDKIELVTIVGGG